MMVLIKQYASTVRKILLLVIELAQATWSTTLESVLRFSYQREENMVVQSWIFLSLISNVAAMIFPEWFLLMVILLICLNTAIPEYSSIICNLHSSWYIELGRECGLLCCCNLVGRVEALPICVALIWKNCRMHWTTSYIMGLWQCHLWWLLLRTGSCCSALYLDFICPGEPNAFIFVHAV